MMNDGSLLDNWKQYWNLLLLRKTFDDAETTLHIFGIQLASSPPEVHQRWIGDALPFTNIADA